MKNIFFAARISMMTLALSMMALAGTSGSAVAERIAISKPYDAYENAALLMHKDEHRDRSELIQLFRRTIGFVDPAQTPWCAGFVDAMLIMSGKAPLGTLWARDFLKYGVAVRKPERGDIVVLSRGRVNGHVGFFHKFVEIGGRTYVGVLGGNTEGRDHPGRVDIGYFPLNKVLGYRRG